MNLLILNIAPWQVALIGSIRLIGLGMMVAVLVRMWQEYQIRPRLHMTKVYLFVLGVAFFIGSLIPLEQAVCFALRACFLPTTVVFTSVITALLNLISILMFFLIYYTKDV